MQRQRNLQRLFCAVVLGFVFVAPVAFYGIS